jgi:hypothetical protein
MTFLDSGRVPKTTEEARTLAEEFAQSAVNFALAKGWSARWQWVSATEIHVFTDGVATNSIEVQAIQ